MPLSLMLSGGLFFTYRQRKMFNFRNLSKVVILSVCFTSNALAMTDAKKLQNAVRIITSQEMKDVSKQEYINAWTDLELLVTKGLGEDEATQVISATLNRYMERWKLKKFTWWSSLKTFDVDIALSGVTQLADCCIKQGFCRKKTIEFIQLVQDFITPQKYACLVTSLLDAGYGLKELEQIAQDGFKVSSIESIERALMIYQCFVEKDLLTLEAFRAVQETMSHCDDEIFKPYSSRAITGPAVRVLTALVDKGHFLDAAMMLATYFLSYPDEMPTNEVRDLLIGITNYDSHAPKVFNLMHQSMLLDNPEIAECILPAISFLVITKGQCCDQAYRVANLAFSQDDVDIRCAGLQCSWALAYRDLYVQESIDLIHSFEQDGNKNICNRIDDLRCVLVARGNLVEEAAVLAGDKDTEDGDALKLYQALVQSGFCLDEAFEKVKQVQLENNGTVYGVLGLLVSLFLQGHRIIEVKKCAISHMKQIGENYNYADELGDFSTIKLFANKKLASFTLKYKNKGEESEMLSDDACQIFFKALFTSPDLAHAKESCQKALAKEGIDPTMFIDVFFE